MGSTTSSFCHNWIGWCCSIWRRPGSSGERVPVAKFKEKKKTQLNLSLSTFPPAVPAGGHSTQASLTSTFCQDHRPVAKTHSHFSALNFLHCSAAFDKMEVPSPGNFLLSGIPHHPSPCPLRPHRLGHSALALAGLSLTLNGGLPPCPDRTPFLFYGYIFPGGCPPGSSRIYRLSIA